MSNPSTTQQETASTDMSTLVRQPMIPLALVAGAFRPQMTACTIATYAAFHAIRWVSAYTIFGHFVLQNHEAYSKTSGQGIYEQMLSAHPVALPMSTLLTRSDATPQTFWAGISFLTVRALGMKKTVGLQATMMGGQPPKQHHPIQTASPALNTLRKTPCLQFGIIYAMAGPSAALGTLATYVGFQASLKASQVAIASQFVLPNLDAAIKSRKGLDLQDYRKNEGADLAIEAISLYGDAGPLSQTYWTGLSFWTMRNFGLKGPMGWQACVVATGFGTLAACWAQRPQEDVQEIRKQHDRVVSTCPPQDVDLNEYVPILQAARVLEGVRNMIRSK
ncbi:hypothetical protein LTR17_016449 [Elasticomyces elasticus]|nr:hypothetical protein LTR17_016449 [Elasticomyces elasticus]